VLAEPAPIKEVEKTNAVIIHPQQQWAGFVPRYNLCAMEVNHSRNYYSCKGFRHLVRNCRNREIVG